MLVTLFSPVAERRTDAARAFAWAPLMSFMRLLAPCYAFACVCVYAQRSLSVHDRGYRAHRNNGRQLWFAALLCALLLSTSS